MHSASMQVSVYTHAIACGNMHSHIFTETALRSEVRTYTHVLSQCQNRFSTICELACKCIPYLIVMYIGMYILYVGVCVVCVRVHVCV